MAPAKKTAKAGTKTVAEDTPVEVVEEIVADEEVEEIVAAPERRAGSTVTFVLDSEQEGEDYDDDDDEEGNGDDDGDDDEAEGDDDEDFDQDMDHEDDLTTAVGQLTQLMMTEEGEAITDVLLGLRDAVEKQNKIMYRGLQLLEAKFGGGRR